MSRSMTVAHMARRWPDVRVVFCVLVVVSCREPVSDRPGSALPRSLSVNGGLVTLGRELPNAIALGVAEDSVTSVRPLEGSGLARVWITLDASHRVTRILADYASSVSYDSLVATEERLRGRPQLAVNTRPGEVASRTATWKDSLTLLQLVVDPNRNAWTVRRVIAARSSDGAP
jgi:hypothetical protein